VILYYFLKCTFFFDKYLWKEKQIVNCVSRNNTNFDGKIKKSGRAHCNNKNMGFYNGYENAPIALIGTFKGRKYF